VVLNEAINALASSGGTIFIKAGSYTFTTLPISLLGTSDKFAIGTDTVSNIELYGEGNSTILTAGSGLNGGILGIGNVVGWYVHDLQINGNRAQQSAGGSNAPGLIGIEAYQTSHVRIERCYVRDNKTYGIFVIDHGYDTVSNNYLYDNLSNGLDIYAGPNGGGNDIVQGNIIVGTSDVGLDISGYSSSVYISNVICTGNVVEQPNIGLDPWGQNSGVGISAGDTGPVNNVTIANNEVYGAVYGISDGGNLASYPTSNVEILDNDIQLTTGYAIHANVYSSTTLIEGNYIGLPPASGKAMGIVTETTAPQTSIIGNEVSASSQSYDLLYIASPSTLIQGNFLEGGGATSIEIKSQSNNIVGNSMLNFGYAAIVLNPSVSGYTQVTDNYIETATGFNCIVVSSNDNTLSGNRLYSTGPGGFEIAAGAVGNIVTDNDVRNVTTPWQMQDGGAKTIIKNNAGYNPVGHVANPFVSGGNYILDSGGSASPVNKTTMTVWESPKMIMVTVATGGYGSPTTGSTLVIQIDGTTVISIEGPAAGVTYSYYLQPGQTFYIQYHNTSDTTFIVSGE
jgi:parallel beta-helix repeat protein